MKKERDLLLISVDSPILLGIYEDRKLVKSYKREGKFSDTLPELFSEILEEYFAKERGEALPKKSLRDEFNIYYANGPGNFSAIKLTHIFLQTLQIALNAIEQNTAKQNIKIFCADAFHFSDYEFINAYGKVHFYKDSALDSKIDSAPNSNMDSAQNSTQNGVIRTITLDCKHPNSFTLPQTLNFRIFSEDCAPLYILPAV